VPGQTRDRLVVSVASDPLQWRAGHVPGQTRDDAGEHCPRHAAPSMEGRARARPNELDAHVKTNVALILQWRAGHVPGQTVAEDVSVPLGYSLQWRAGHVPGQTARLIWCP